MKKDYVIDGKDGKPIRFSIFQPNQVDAVVVVIHGMQEHSGRYVEFASRLNDKNIAVILSDLRGHGTNMEYGAGLDAGNIYQNIVDDQKAIINKIDELYPDKRKVVFGHSYGSFVTQRLIKDRVNVDKFVLSGSGYMKGPIISAGALVAGVSRVFKGREAEAKMIENMSIKGYGKGFPDGNWLSRDEKVWENYKLDQLCGKAFPVAFYQSMFKELPKNYSKLKNSVGYRPNIVLIAGEDDPVGNFGKGVKKLAEVYKNAGFKVQVMLYAGGRHEMHNETNKDEVYNYITDTILN